MTWRPAVSCWSRGWRSSWTSSRRSSRGRITVISGGTRRRIWAIVLRTTHPTVAVAVGVPRILGTRWRCWRRLRGRFGLLFRLRFDLKQNHKINKNRYHDLDYITTTTAVALRLPAVTHCLLLSQWAKIREKNMENIRQNFVKLHFLAILNFFPGKNWFLAIFEIAKKWILFKKFFSSNWFIWFQRVFFPGLF